MKRSRYRPGRVLRDGNGAEVETRDTRHLILVQVVARYLG